MIAKKFLSATGRRFLLAGGAVLFLSGCGHMRYAADSNGFNGAYADSSNRQMLLNLARLDQHDPTYFLQFGQITVSYQFSGSLNGMASDTIPQSTIHVPLVSPSGSLSLGGSTQPQFTFIPVNDSTVAQELLQPVHPDVLYALFQGGAPVDQLLRLMVERFEIQLPGQKGFTTYTNSLVHGDVSSFATFLKICAIARELQLAGCLELQAKTEFLPLADGWTSDAQPSAKDLLDAHDKGMTYEKQDGGWVLGHEQLVPRFLLKPGSDVIIAQLKQSRYYQAGTSLQNMAALLGGGFSVEGNFRDQANPGSHLVLRSFLSILASAAQEETDFETVAGQTKLLPLLPPSESRPILRLKWSAFDSSILPPLIQVTYHGVEYKVTDPSSHIVDEAASWNRDVFTLLTQLASQVSVDISKFPLPTTLQVLPSP